MIIAIHGLPVRHHWSMAAGAIIETFPGDDPHGPHDELQILDKTQSNKCATDTFYDGFLRAENDLIDSIVNRGDGRHGLM